MSEKRKASDFQPWAALQQKEDALLPNFTYICRVYIVYHFSRKRSLNWTKFLSIDRNVLKLLLTDTLRSLNRRYYISARRYEIPLLRLARAEFSFREEKFRMSKRPCNVLLINDISINEIPNHFNFIFLAAKGVIIFLCSYSNGKLSRVKTTCLIFLRRVRYHVFAPKLCHLVFPVTCVRVFSDFSLLMLNLV